MFKALIAFALAAVCVAQTVYYEAPEFNKKYWVNDANLVYDEQVKHCSDRGGQLLKMESAEEAEWLRDNVNITNFAFLGAKKNSINTWLDGTKMTWTNWDSDEPTNGACQLIMFYSNNMKWSTPAPTSRGKANGEHYRVLIIDCCIDRNVQLRRKSHLRNEAQRFRREKTVVNPMAGCTETSSAKQLNAMARDVATCAYRNGELETYTRQLEKENELLRRAIKK